MSFICPHCQAQLSIDKSVPKFCSQCGSPLSNPTVLSQSAPPESGLEATAVFSGLAIQNRTPGVRMDDATEHPSGGPPQPSTLPAGTVVGDFLIGEVLGAGGMGTVYRATHTDTGQVVALKLLSRSLRTTDASVQRFQRESQIAASINHPRSTFVYRAGQHEGQFYITMELMTGGTLDDIVKGSGAVPIGTAVDYVLDIIDGLQAAHEAGIVHRDLKPSNCFLDQNGRVKIGDYGLAKSFVTDSSLTQTGAFMGTPQYAAPEQLRTSEIDERADMYAVGGTLFYLLGGRPPFVGNAAQVISSIASDQPPRISSLDSKVPRELCRVIHQTLEKNPERRPVNLDELRQLLLPYSTRGAAIADSGRRMAAFFVDALLIGIMIGLVAQLLGVTAQMLPSMNFERLFLVSMFVSVLLSIGYFSILETRFGTSPGKWLLGMRVVTLENRNPRLGQAILKAAVMPGLSYLFKGLAPYLVERFWPMALGQVDSTLWNAAIMQFLELFGWLPIAVCFVTAKRINGYRGIHELISGTRVVRISGNLDYHKLRCVPVTVPILGGGLETQPADQTLEVGSTPQAGFAVNGEVARTLEEEPVLAGRDESLDREVWIFEQAVKPSWLTPARVAVTRATRLRILQQESEDGRTRWVTEPVRGMPIGDFLRLTPNLDWRSIRPLFQELVTELERASQDDTLPQRLTIEQIWVNDTGHVKLLDQPLQLTGQSGTTAQEVSTPMQLVSTLLDLLIENQVVPAHVLTFRQELEILNSDPQPLQRIAERLEDLAEQPSGWRWDDRLGVLAVSCGLELSIAGTLAVGGVLTVALLEPSLRSMAVGVLLLTSLTALLLGGLTRGGPVFRSAGVLVRRNRTLAPASAIRCAIRNWVAWLPWILFLTCLACIATLEVQLVHKTSGLDGPTSQMLLVVCLLLSAAALFLALVGASYSVLRPPRGLADLVAGTRLIRK